MAVMKQAKKRNLHHDGSADKNPLSASEVHSAPFGKAESALARCEVCGNDYDKSFTVTMANQTHTFDSFECAIQALAPTCGHCGCKVIGHGVEKEGAVFCCAHCADSAGAKGLKDRA